jgi:hypothetical protein
VARCRCYRWNQFDDCWELRYSSEERSDWAARYIVGAADDPDALTCVLYTDPAVILASVSEPSPMKLIATLTSRPSDVARLRAWVFQVLRRLRPQADIAADVSASDE